MAIIQLESKTVARSRGYPLVTGTLYVYCDECGSFNVKKYMGFEKWFVLLVIIGMAFAAYNITAGNPVFMIFVVLPVSIIFLKWGWSEDNYRCQKCGNTRIALNNEKAGPLGISELNVLHYPNDSVILDVSDKQAQKRYITYWPDMYDM